MADITSGHRAAPAPRSQPEAAMLRDLVPLRPQSPVELVDRATHLFRTRARDLWVITATVNVPIWLVLAVLLRDDWARGLSDNAVWFWAGLVPEPFLGGMLAGNALDGGTWAFVVGRALPSMGLAVTGAACGHLVAAWSEGRDLAGGDALRRVARQGHWLLLLWAIVHAIEVVTVVGLAVGPFLFGVAAPLWAMEGGRPWTVVRRSARLSLKRLGSVIGTVLVATLVTSLLGALLAGVPLLIVLGVFGQWTELGGTATVALAGVLPHLVIQPLVGLTMALLAIDLKVRLEAADLRADLAALPRRGR